MQIHHLLWSSVVAVLDYLLLGGAHERDVDVLIVSSEGVCRSYRAVLYFANSSVNYET